MATVWPTRSLFLRPRWGRWYGMVNVDLYSAIITKVFNALNTLVSREKPGFQTLSKGLVVLLCAKVVRQRVPDHGGGVVRWTYMFVCRYTRTQSLFYWFAFARRIGRADCTVRLCVRVSVGAPTQAFSDRLALPSTGCAKKAGPRDSRR